jgi:hypothetical protein
MANLDDLNATLQDVVRAVNNLNETLVAGLPAMMVPRSALERALAAVNRAIVPYPANSDLSEARIILDALLGV